MKVDFCLRFWRILPYFYESLALELRGVGFFSQRLKITSAGTERRSQSVKIYTEVGHKSLIV